MKDLFDIITKEVYHQDCTDSYPRIFEAHESIIYGLQSLVELDVFVQPTLQEVKEICNG